MLLEPIFNPCYTRQLLTQPVVAAIIGNGTLRGMTFVNNVANNNSGNNVAGFLITFKNLQHVAETRCVKYILYVIFLSQHCLIKTGVENQLVYKHQFISMLSDLG